MLNKLIVLLALLIYTLPAITQEKIYIWSEIEPGWKTGALEHWSSVKGYGKSVPEKMMDMITGHFDNAEQMLQLALKEEFLKSGLPGTNEFVTNPGSVIPGDHDLFMDIQCKILEISDIYPNFRIRKLYIKPVVQYAITLYNSRGEKIAEKNFVDHVDYKNKIRPRLRGMPEHRRDIEIVRHAFTESFSGNTPGRMISDISALIQKHHVQSIVADQDHFIQIVGLVFEKRKLQYPVKYKDVRFERLSTANTVNETETTTQHRQDTELILARELTSLIEHANYYALLIGVNDYADPTINDLLEPMNDVNKFYSTLVTNYTFTNENVTVLKNPTRNKLIQTLDKLASEITEKDNLLVFYAGHGLWDEQLKKGFWFPSDASADNRSNWFSNADLRDYIGGIEARHTLLISDACFSGGIFKTREVFTGVTPATLELYKLPSRKAMTSGAMTNVPDKSVFIEYLIKRLDENTSYFLSAEQLFASFKLAVINNSSTSQVPQFGEIRETGDEGGDFLFIRKK